MVSWFDGPTTIRIFGPPRDFIPSTMSSFQNTAERDNNVDAAATTTSSSSPPMPTYSGNFMPLNVAVHHFDDDLVPETTRRIGGGTTFHPTFESVSVSSLDHVTPRQESALDETVNATHPHKQHTQQIHGTTFATSRGGCQLMDAPELPAFRPLDLMSVFVEHVSVGEVAQRVAQVLKDRSIQAHYDESNATITCLTSYNLDFKIFLYRGQKQYSHGVIVEVQRRSGASFRFANDAQAILDAAQGRNTMVPGPPPLSSTAEMPLVSDSDNDEDGPQETTSLSSLDFCWKMIDHHAYEPQLLGLQTLMSLTDKARMGTATAAKVSAAIVQPNNQIGAKLVALVNDKSPTDEGTGLRTLAMTILANVIRSVDGNINQTMRDAVRPILLQELMAAEKTPQMAYLAATCLEPLLHGDCNRSEFSSVLATACRVGEAKHTGLLNQAKQCMQKVETM